MWKKKINLEKELKKKYISVFDNIGNSDEITLKFSGTDSDMIDSEVKKLRNSKNIISDLSMIGNNIKVDIVTSDLEDIEDDMSDIKDDFVKDLDNIRSRME